MFRSDQKSAFEGENFLCGYISDRLLVRLWWCNSTVQYSAVSGSGIDTVQYQVA